jgi:hypothetical protein
MKIRRYLRSGAIAGAVSSFTFTALHHLLISDIWFALIPMMAAGALCGLCLAWTYGLLFERPSAASWLWYNGVYVALFVLLGLVSIVVYEPITTVAAVLEANESPRELFGEAMPLTVIFTLGSALLISLLWGRSLAKAGAVLLTCAVLVVLLGLNVSVLGLVYFPGDTLYRIAQLFALIVVLNVVFLGAFLFLERESLRVQVPAAALTK